MYYGEDLRPEGAWKRVLLTLEYDGTDYVGWQTQMNGRGVQQEVEEALQKATGVYTPVCGASRTDAGVHAAGQRAHFDTKSRIPCDKYPFVFNSLLPPDISVVKADFVHPALHARFSAEGKRYTYRIDNGRQASALRRRFYAHVPLPLDVERMQAAADELVGTHDFSAFCAAGGSAKTTVRTLKTVTVERNHSEVLIKVEGNAFLYNMVRIIAGTLSAIGTGKMSGEVIRMALTSGNRRLLGPTAPACGLELTKVYYEGGL